MAEEASQVPLEISVVDTQATLQADAENCLLLDCRNPDELEVARIDGARLIPMDQIPERVAELDAYRDKQLLVICHAGVRSAMVANWLRDNGFERAQSVAGGIDAWSVLIDPSVPRY